MTGNPIVLVNRTTSNLKFVADSKHYELKPGPNYGFLEAHARFAQAQNPLPGSEIYHSLDFTSLIGVKDVEGNEISDCSPISDEAILEAEERSLGERFDREASGLSRAMKVKNRHPRMTGRMTTSADQTVLAVGGQ